MNSLLTAVTALAVTAVASGSAHANPVYVGYSLDGGQTITDIGNSGNDGTAGTSGTFVGAGQFSIELAGTGQAAGQPSSLVSTTVTVDSASSGSITLYVSEINETTRPIFFTTSFGNDPMSSISAIETSTLGLFNSKYSLARPFALGSASLAPGSSASNSVAAPASLPALYSLTEAFTFNFGSGGGQVLANIGVTAQIGATAIPEPMSLAVLGGGLASVGLIRRRKHA